jgi:uncharacterized protein (TIGR02611 family)
MAVAEKELKRADSAPRTWLPLPWAVWFWTQARKIVVFVLGSTVLALGVVMLVTPGPGWVTIFGGLVILASEFAWARWMLKVARRRAGELVDLARQHVNSVANSVKNSSKP